MADEAVVEYARLQALATDIFCRAGLPGDEAHLVADALVLADLRGMHSHGVLRAPVYVPVSSIATTTAKPRRRELRSSRRCNHIP